MKINKNKTKNGEQLYTLELTEEEIGYIKGALDSDHYIEDSEMDCYAAAGGWISSSDFYDIDKLAYLFYEIDKLSVDIKPIHGMWADQEHLSELIKCHWDNSWKKMQKGTIRENKEIRKRIKRQELLRNIEK